MRRAWICIRKCSGRRLRSWWDRFFQVTLYAAGESPPPLCRTICFGRDDRVFLGMGKAAELRSWTGQRPISTRPFHLLTLFFFMFNCKIFYLVVAALLLSSCAQMGPPVPPSLELPKVVTDLKA